MSRIHDRQQAIELRKQGKTYSEIKASLGIAKSTLSDWLSTFPLEKEQLQLLQKTKDEKRYIAAEKSRITKQKKRQARLDRTYQQEKKRWTSLTQRELELAGIFLYWGEGSKSLKGAISLNNTDPKVLTFTLYWLTKGLQVPKEKIKVFLHLYDDMDIDAEKQFWSKKLQLPLSQFSKPYIKRSKRVAIEHKGFGHGTCGLVICDVRLKEKIIMAIDAIADSYSEYA